MFDTLTEVTEAIDNLNMELFELNGEKETLEFYLHWSPGAWQILFGEFPILSDQELVWDDDKDTHFPIEEQLRHRFKKLQSSISQLALNKPTQEFEDNTVW